MLEHTPTIETDLPASGVFAGAQRALSYQETAYSGPVAVVPDSGTEPASAEAAPAEAAKAQLASPAELGALSAASGRAVARAGARGALARLGIRVRPGKAEQARLDEAACLSRDEETIRQATWTRAVGILVANRKGGTGKTPAALLLGGALAATRGGSVAVMEVSDDPGALAFRAEGDPARGLGELIRDLDNITTAGRLAGYTAPQASFASVIGTVGRRPRLSGSDVQAIARVVDEFYAIRVMDSGNQPSSDAFQGAVETADVLVVPVLNAGDAVLEAVATIEELRAAGGKAARLAAQPVILRLTDGRPEHPQVIERIDRIIAGLNPAAVFAVPYDPHIAERGQLTLSRLQAATRAALTQAAAGVVRVLQSTAE